MLSVYIYAISERGPASSFEITFEFDFTKGDGPRLGGPSCSKKVATSVDAVRPYFDSDSDSAAEEAIMNDAANLNYYTEGHRILNHLSLN